MRINKALPALVLAGASIVGIAPAATAADGCYGAAYGYSNYTSSTSDNCNTQARISRYNNSQVYNYYGTFGHSSYISNTSGYNAGNAIRIGSSGWITFTGYMLTT